MVYNGVLLPKYSSFTEDVNKVLGQMRAGDLIYHYARLPLYLEQTLDQEMFTFYDNSKDKLSLENLFLIFVTLLFGMVLSAVALLAEILHFRYRAARG